MQQKSRIHFYEKRSIREENGFESVKQNKMGEDIK
jgi:hypothetical protein